MALQVSGRNAFASGGDVALDAAQRLLIELLGTLWRCGLGFVGALVIRAGHACFDLALPQ